MVAGMCLTGCISPPKDMFDPAVELEQGTIKFQLAEKRWPMDYDDLSGFLMRSHDPTYASLKAVKFHRLKFIALPDGGIKIDMNYTTTSGDAKVKCSFGIGKPEIIPEQPH